MLAFAGSSDPLDRAHEVAAELLQLAEREGLAGPPIDVFGLAQRLGLGLRPKNDLLDAQIMPAATTPTGGLVIEYNPSRPRGRLRFSVAHEVAHSRFADVAHRPRHRSAAGSVEDPKSDDWELELLCDVIAADVLIPDRAVEGLLTVDPDIDLIMETRRKWDVSTEALLRRLVSATPRPLVLLATSKPTGSATDVMRVDYIVRSRVPGTGVLADLKHGDHLVGVSVLTRCSAVGQTVRGTSGPGEDATFIQAVGIPAYPGSRRPRVLALIEPRSIRLNKPNLQFVTSDLLDVPRADTPVIFAHVVSDAAHRWSYRGVAGTLARAYPDFAQAFRSWSIASPENLKLGNVHYVERAVGGREVGSASLVAQEGFGGAGPLLRYDALDKSLDELARLAISRGAAVHLPRLGVGQAGGRWDFVEAAIVQRLTGRGINVTVHTRPNESYQGAHGHA